MLARIRQLSLFIAVMAVLLALSLYGILSLSLPHLEGKVHSRMLQGAVDVHRDQLGIPTIQGSNRADIAFATGYLHAQDRFFQMDLNRRNSAGELSALFGEIALDHDKKVRIHQFREVARNVVAYQNEESKQILQAYTDGVNKGLSDLVSRPFEYWLLKQKPQPWQLEDAFLAVFSMYLDLSDEMAAMDQAKGFLASVAGKEVAEFLSPPQTRWDAPLIEDNGVEPQIPGPDVINLRTTPASDYVALSGNLKPVSAIGSNNFAVAGRLSETGAAIVEDDMHLGLRVPTVWYRAQLIYKDGTDQIRVNGLTLPGTPFVVVGSNGSVAWAFTNSFGDWNDRVSLELTEEGLYKTSAGPREFDVREHTIDVKGQEPVIHKTRYTIWGPVSESKFDGSLQALRWTAHNPEATNSNLYLLEKAEDIYEAVNVANISGIPPQNFTVGDSKGNVGWTIAGRIPNRSGVDSTYPLTWQQAELNWQGWLPVDNYPMVLNPAHGRIWTANSRVASGADYKKLGNGGYAPGPRTLQIRNALNDKEAFHEKDLLAIALDDTALYMSSWRSVVLQAIEADQGKNESWEEFARLVSNWSGRAAPEDVGYRLVREFQDVAKLKVLKHLGRYFILKGGAHNTNVDDGWLQDLNREESAVLRLLELQPENWLPPVYKTWDALVLESVDEVVKNLGGADQLAERTWGERNTTRINHPLSSALPVIGQWLNMPTVVLAGDIWTPRAQKPSVGVSERMIVSPGYEERGIMHIPGGQSGHPLSSFYQAGFDDWLKGKPSAFLPGKTRYTLTFRLKQTASH
ncbi:penicillin acylase family protein [Sansalvadorimonas verongulae]|uniref:penicillin acylase family protein n=1 Tax=Sansalvadorimonas verongulae TaxID=2172824 RepID=UPI0012BC8E65|nr:penicillin acylase family protein [Sansalvadorimonas verongulae]MTI13838.1 penicillin acylase family protein [Sansalvadorimonas verongulae]